MNFSIDVLLETILIVVTAVPRVMGLAAIILVLGVILGGLLTMSSGQSDAVVMPSNLGAEEIINELDLNVNTADEPVQVNPTYFMMGQDQEDLKVAMDEAIAQLKEDGTMQELSEKWYGENIFDYQVTNN